MASTDVVTQSGDPGPNADLMTRLDAMNIPATLSANYPALDVESEALEAVVENLGGEFEDIPLEKMPKIKFPTGGETLFNIPDATTKNGVRQERDLKVIIVANQSRRAFWPTVKLTGDRPTCFALDGRNGEGEYGRGSAANPTGKCKRCPMAEYGSKANLEGALPDAGGQACKQTRLLYLLTPGSVLPMQMAAPPTSLAGLEEWLLNLGGAGIPFHAIEAELRLSRVDGENPYAVLSVNTVRTLDENEREVTKAYASALKGMLARSGVDDVAAEMAGAAGVGEDGEATGGVSFGDEPAAGGFDNVGESESEGAYDGEAAGAARSGARASAKG